MVIDLLFVGLLLVSALLFTSGKPLNIHITHTHKVIGDNPAGNPAMSEQDEDLNDTKDVAEFIQDFLGVINEE